MAFRISFTQGCSEPSLDEIGPVVLKKKFLNILNIIFTISILSPLGERVDLHFKKLEPPSHKDSLCKFSGNWPSGSEENFQISSILFYNFTIISPWRRVWPFI